MHAWNEFISVLLFLRRKMSIYMRQPTECVLCIKRVKLNVCNANFLRFRVKAKGEQTVNHLGNRSLFALYIYVQRKNSLWRRFLFYLFSFGTTATDIPYDGWQWSMTFLCFFFALSFFLNDVIKMEFLCARLYDFSFYFSFLRCTNIILCWCIMRIGLYVITLTWVFI